MNADLVIWNPEAQFEVTENEIRHRHKISPYIGKEMFGEVQQTFVNGFSVYPEEGKARSPAGKVILNN